MEVPGREQQEYEGRGQRADGDPGDADRTQVAAEKNFHQAAAELRESLQRGKPHGRGRGQARCLEQWHQLHRDHAEHEPVQGHHQREQHDRHRAHAAGKRRTVEQIARVAPLRGGGLRARRFAPRQPEPVQRQAYSQVDGGEDHQRLAPADGLIEVMPDHPEHGRGEGAEQREIRDRPPPARRHHLDQRRERRVVEAQPHAHAEEGPYREIGRLDAHQRQRVEAGRYQQRADRHHAARAVAVDGAARPCRHRAHREQRRREAEIHQAGAPASVGGDRAGQNAQGIVARAPGRDLRDAERADRGQHRVRFR